MATATPKTTPQVQKHHYIRTLFSSFFGFIAVGLIITSVLAIWLDATLTNTNQYVNTVAIGLLMVVLLFKPEGLFGSTKVRPV